MNLYLLRHGLALDPADHAGSDATRPLTRAGKEQLADVARALRRMEVQPDVVLSSPLVRARETAAVLIRELQIPAEHLQITRALEPGADTRQLLKELSRLTPSRKHALLVGHEPGLSGLASLLISGSGNPVLSFKKAGLARIDCPSLIHGRCGALCWLLTPAQMEWMG